MKCGFSHCQFHTVKLQLRLVHIYMGNQDPNEDRNWDRNELGEQPIRARVVRVSQPITCKLVRKGFAPKHHSFRAAIVVLRLLTAIRKESWMVYEL